MKACRVLGLKAFRVWGLGFRETCLWLVAFLTALSLTISRLTQGRALFNPNRRLLAGGAAAWDLQLSDRATLNFRGSVEIGLCSFNVKDISKVTRRATFHKVAVFCFRPPSRSSDFA